MDCGCKIKNLPYTDADVAPASIAQCPLHAAAEKLRDALTLAQKVCHERFCDPHPMGQSEVCKVASDALTEAKGE